MPRSARSILGGDAVVRVIVHAVSVLTLTGALLLPCALSATTYTPLKVLFVANGNYSQETYIQNHLTALGATVTKMKDYQVKSTTNFAAYDLLLITEFAPNIPGTALAKIKTAGVPVLIVEYWDFWYSYTLGLTTTDSCGYVGTTTVELLDDATRAGEYAGGTPQVYSTSYTVYGISEFDLKAGVEAVAWSSTSFGEYAMIIDRARNIAATGVYDTRKYTTEAWILFDETISEIAPLGPAWESDEEALQGYVDSGLWSYIENLTGNETEAAVRAYVWPKIYAYNLHRLIPTMEYGIQLNFGTDFSLLGDIQIPISPFRPLYFNDTDLDMRWLIGEHCTDTDGFIDSNEYDPLVYGNKIEGADLGISVDLGSRTYFYMGDTWGSISADGCAPNASLGAVQCDDSILRVDHTEISPELGVNAVPVVSTPSTGEVLSQTIPGIHREYSDEVWELYDTDNKGFSVPVGASVSMTTKWATFNGTPVVLLVTQARLWYGTQTTRDATVNGKPELAGKSWVGCSLDGTSFANCYPKYTKTTPTGGTVDVYPYFSNLNFVMVSPVEIGPDELAAMGANAPTSPSNRGTLLFGVTRPYRCSALYLAYVDAADFGLVDANGHPQNVQYYTGLPGSDMWSNDEAISEPLISPACLSTDTDLDPQDPDYADQQNFWYDERDIFSALFAENLWRHARWPLQYPVIYSNDVSGCDYSTQTSCDPQHCWAFGSSASPGCLLCTHDQVETCAELMTDAVFNAADPVIHYPWPATDGFGELSVKLVKSGDHSAYVMLSNHPLVDSQERQDMLDAISVGIEVEPTWGPWILGRFARERFRWDNMDVFLRTAPASAPWSWSEPIDTGKPGYVGGIIDAFTSFSYAMTISQDCVYKLTAANLWFTTSVWHGDPPPHGNGLPGAYGVYTTSTKTPFLWSELMHCGDTDVEP